MPVRSLSSSVLIWPDKDQVHSAASEWARELAIKRPDVMKVGYTGSYAQGTWGFGSDIDLVIVVDTTVKSFLERGREIDVTSLPVPADVLIYTADEWAQVKKRKLGALVAWIYPR